MRLRSGLLLALALGLTVAVVGAGSTRAGTTGAVAAPRQAAEPAPVASLEPRATEKLWRRLVATRSRRARATADCRPLRAVFYTATDYLRLATKLAANASPCADYYVSIPPLVADKTQPRPNAASRIRALGPNFHALAEIHFATWTKWVANNGATWFDAGVTARARMAAAGYDVSKGDSWALNELTSAVRKGTGNARANVRELLRGLYTGDGSRPTRGAVFVIGVGQQTSNVSLYQTNLQNWFADSAFWTDMNTYVSDWSQEVYGDMRNWAVPGAAEPVRRDYLNDYLQHELVLAGVAPPSIDAVRTYLQAAYSPLANAAWQRETGYGWTMVPPEQMEGYVSSQVHALRYFSATTGQPQDHWGFAWAPRNGSGLSAADFATQSGLVLDRLGAAVRDSAQTPDPADPGSAACGPSGQNCAGDIVGARLNEAWKSFRVWTQPVLTFATPAQTISAGSPSAAMSLSLLTSSGLRVNTPVPLAVTLTSSSPDGVFSTSAAGPWTSTLVVTIPAGTGASPAFYYEDTRAGAPVLTASATGVTNGTQTETVTPGAIVALAVAPASATVPARTSRQFVARGTDTFGNAFPVSAIWSLAPQAIGTVAPATGGATTFTAGRTPGAGTLTAVLTGSGTLSASATVRVTPGKLRIGSIGYRTRQGTLYITVSALDLRGKPVSRALVSALVRLDGRRYSTARAPTGTAGRTVYRMPVPRRGGCLTTTITTVSAPGFAWDGHTPRNRYCRPRSG